MAAINLVVLLSRLKCLLVFQLFIDEARLFSNSPQPPYVYLCSSIAKLILNSTVVAGSQTSQLLFLSYMTSLLPKQVSPALAI